MNATANLRQFANGNKQRLGAMAVVLIVVVAIAALWLLCWSFIFSQRENTENAYVGGHQVQITAQTSGTVTGIYADDTQQVRAGQLLVQMDAADATVALDRARAGLVQSVRRVLQMRGTAAQYEAQVAARKFELAQAQDDLNRRLPLLKTHAMSPEQVQHAQGVVAVARASLEAARRAAEAARAPVGNAELLDQPEVQTARAAFAEAWLGLQRTRILAPASGGVAQRTVQIGNRVQPGLPLMRLIPLDALWVDANFKEAEIRNLRVGQAAAVEVDLYGGSVVFHGKVAGFSPGTGAAFALLPPQNAAGNWVKVVQRLPVRIELDAKQMAEYPLRIGLSAHVRVDTHDRSGSRLSPAAAVPGEGAASSAGLELATTQANEIIAASAISPTAPP